MKKFFLGLFKEWQDYWDKGSIPVPEGHHDLSKIDRFETPREYYFKWGQNLGHEKKTTDQITEILVSHIRQDKPRGQRSPAFESSIQEMFIDGYQNPYAEWFSDQKSLTFAPPLHELKSEDRLTDRFYHFKFGQNCGRRSMSGNEALQLLVQDLYKKKKLTNTERGDFWEGFARPMAPIDAEKDREQQALFLKQMEKVNVDGLKDYPHLG